MSNDQSSVAGSDPIVRATLTFMLALCIFREARGETVLGQRAVANVILNRAKRPGWWGSDVFTVITKAYQFSSFNKGEPNSIVYGAPNDASWHQCFAVAQSALDGSLLDNTIGATFYYDKSLDAMPPVWASKYKHLCDIGSFRFFTDKV